jgi:threonine/homoserine/homoserine lactone efflux protein
MGGAFWKSLLFGALLAASIGPIALLIFGTAARRGFAAGGFAALGAALADLVYALTAFSAGALILPLLAAHEAAVHVASALLLVALGLVMLLRRPPAAVEAAATPAGRSASMLLPVFLLTLVNPMTIVVFAGFAPQLPLAGSVAVAAGLAIALGAGSLAVALAVAAAGAAFGAVLPGAGWQRLISLISAAGILAFGIYGLVAALGP